MKINIVDSIMGSGKTQAAINYIKNSDDMTKFLYVTPFISEVERIVSACAEKEFHQPYKYNDKAPKIISLKDMLNKGKNIVTTHALFHYFDDEVIDLCYSQGYVLIMDEVTDVIQPYKHLKPDDLDTLLEKYVIRKDNGLLYWKEEYRDYDGDKFQEEKLLCDMECLAMYGSSVMVWMFPTKIFRAFRDSYILTYMFSGQMQKYYYDYHSLEYNYLYVAGNSLDTYHFVTEEVKHKAQYDYRKLITIWDEPKLNMIGDGDYSLSKNWYVRNENNNLIKQLKNNTLNFFNNKKILYNAETDTWDKSYSDNNLWTTFKDYKKALSGKGYSKGFLACTVRATNEYRDRSAVAYLVNRYLNSFIKIFFQTYHIQIDEDAYALSEMLQFIWRSAIRDGQHITVYIPSRRMRLLLQQWIESQEYE